MNSRLAPTLLMLMLPLCTMPALAGDDHDHDSPFAGMPLPMLMHNMQYYSHKLGLAVDAGNYKLKHFYGHELEEVIEAVGEIDDYDGLPIAENIGKTLVPAFEVMEAAIDGGDSAKVDAAYDQLLSACNACHRASERPFVVIQRNRDNPYPQDFSPQD